MTVGNARPLDQCVQHATTEMVRWLQEDYGLDTRSAHILLDQCVQYDLGNVFDPRLHNGLQIVEKTIGVDRLPFRTNGQHRSPQRIVAYAPSAVAAFS